MTTWFFIPRSHTGISQLCFGRCIELELLWFWNSKQTGTGGPLAHSQEWCSLGILHPSPCKWLQLPHLLFFCACVQPRSPDSAPSPPVPLTPDPPWLKQPKRRQNKNYYPVSNTPNKALMWRNSLHNPNGKMANITNRQTCPQQWMKWNSFWSSGNQKTYVTRSASRWGQKGYSLRVAECTSLYEITANINTMIQLVERLNTT